MNRLVKFKVAIPFAAVKSAAGHPIDAQQSCIIQFCKDCFLFIKRYGYVADCFLFIIFMTPFENNYYSIFRLINDSCSSASYKGNRHVMHAS